MFQSKLIPSLSRGKCLLTKKTNNFLRETVTKRRCLSINSLSLSAASDRVFSRVKTSSKFILAPAARMATTWSMGPGTLEVPLSLFAKNRKRLADKLKSGQVVVLQGGDSISHYDTDIEYVFRQEAYFTWVCGVREPGCYFALDVSTGKSHLFVPHHPEEYEVWMGKLLSCSEIKKIYGVDEVHYVEELHDVIKKLNPEVLLTLSGPNTDSGLTAKEAVFDGINEFKVNNEILFPIIAELRVIKTPEEIEVLRYVTKISSDAHKQVMLYTKPGLKEYQCESVFLDYCYRVGGCRHVSYTCICGSGFTGATLHYGHAAAPNSKIIQDGDMWWGAVTVVGLFLYTKPGLKEYQCESVFLDYCYRVGGCRHVSYTCICGSGFTGATLHYGHAAAPNSKIIQDGDMCLFDMGGNYAGYAADITCSFPANGKFTEDQKLVYEAVLAGRDAVIREAKPGVMWPDMHLAANRAMLEHLKKGNLLKGDVEEMIKAGVNGILQPHGLGHLIGLDVHDVGGYLPHCPPRPDGPLARLRTARRLQAGMLLTIEPGCYFIKRLLDGARANPEQSKFFNWDMMERFYNFGGVRIEDDVLITETGVENLTFVPRTVAEIEEFMANGANFKK